MCGLNGIISLDNEKISSPIQKVNMMNNILKHRGPDGSGYWVDDNELVAFGHVRLSIIDLSDKASQPMINNGNALIFNGEIYNFLEIKQLLSEYVFQTNSDTEVILKAYEKWGIKCLDYFRGMFSFALWDKEKKSIFIARDRFGIKPLYYSIINSQLVFASEAKALLKFTGVETDLESLSDYLHFQFVMGKKTLFKNIFELLPSHYLFIDTKKPDLDQKRYWKLNYKIDHNSNEDYFKEKLKKKLIETIQLHLRSDVPIGAYISGGIDSSSIGVIAQEILGKDKIIGFNGYFSNEGQEFDENKYAQSISNKYGFELISKDITSKDFLENINNVIFHLDFPVAGPGSFSQYMISKEASKFRKVLLGGQGGDEIFGGYVRYIIAYFEQCILGAIDGNNQKDNFVLTYESIIPNLTVLKEYKGMLKTFWAEGLFDPMENRYFNLIDRSRNLKNIINWDYFGSYNPSISFFKLFDENKNISNSYLDKMMHFDFLTSLPALLQVEDRMSMANGIESRVPLLDHELIELIATIPANIKLKNGKMKYIFSEVTSEFLSDEIKNRKDKKGFPTPINLWAKKELRSLFLVLLKNLLKRDLPFINRFDPDELLKEETNYSRSLWSLISLEIWYQQFHDSDLYKVEFTND